jgi:hypothetical protein
MRYQSTRLYGGRPPRQNPKVARRPYSAPPLAASDQFDRKGNFYVSVKNSKSQMNYFSLGKTYWTHIAAGTLRKIRPWRDPPEKGRWGRGGALLT